jgi:phage tail sheath protein FI
MPVQVSYPGVYVEELPSGSHTITGVPTAITAFIGRAPRGSVDEPMTVTSMGNFEQLFGEVTYNYPLTYAVRDFFKNGGSEAIIVRRFIAPTSTSSTPSTSEETGTNKTPAKKGAK